MKAEWFKHTLKFINPGGTSRGILHEKTSYYIKLSENNRIGIGECGILKGLSWDDKPGYESVLNAYCENPHQETDKLEDWPSIRAGIEMALIDLQSDHPFLYFPTEFTKGALKLPINGLVWMGSKREMRSRIIEKIEDHFTCIKLKVGALNFDEELALLSFLRSEFSQRDIEIRLDANGAFLPEEALEKLKTLSQFDIQSIEQPIKPGQIDKMASICEQSPIPVALDEELIGVFGADQATLLKSIKPQYIILKPSFVGGFKASQKWIDLAEAMGTGWWITSALESNIGLNAIAQWTATLKPTLAQGLGTGGLFSNNFDSPLHIANGSLHYNPKHIAKNPFA